MTAILGWTLFGACISAWAACLLAVLIRARVCRASEPSPARINLALRGRGVGVVR